MLKGLPQEASSIGPGWSGLMHRFDGMPSSIVKATWRGNSETIIRRVARLDIAREDIWMSQDAAIACNSSLSDVFN
jgi:hypothetical protein